jgi:hypothetical protein
LPSNSGRQYIAAAAASLQPYPEEMYSFRVSASPRETPKTRQTASMSNPFHESSPAGANPFADHPNPYATPIEAGYAPPHVHFAASPFAGLWRQGNLLVMHKAAPLPDICLKSNEPATRRLKRKLSWHHPAIYLVILAHLLIYIVVALIVRKTATIHIPLTEDWYQRRQRRMFFAWAMILLSALLLVASIVFFESHELAPLGIIAAILLGLGAAIYGLVACRLVAPKRMTDEYIWLKGVHHDFLARLEPWQWTI